MNVQSALKTQYHAALGMLKQAIALCPDDLWTGGDDPVAFWRVVYHTLFFTHLYLQPNNEAFRRWQHHRNGCEHLGRPPSRPPKVLAAYTKSELLEYWQLIEAMVDNAVDTLDLDAKDCGFHWYKLRKLDHQINNIRHVQHHAALLAGRLRRARGTDIPWLAS